MSFFRRKKTEESKPKSTIDKIVMGAIIGTAIGSVIGLSVAPKPGKETRKELQKELGEIGQLTKETVSGVGTLIKNLLFGEKKKQKSLKEDKHLYQDLKDLKKIPEEEESTSEAIPR